LGKGADLVQTQTKKEIGEKRKLQKKVIGKDPPDHSQTGCHHNQTANDKGDLFRFHTLGLPQFHTLASG
jgi:hypothetical protein